MPTERRSAAVSGGPINRGGTFEAGRQTEEMLLRAIAQCDEDRTTPMAGMLSELRGRE